MISDWWNGISCW